MADPQATYHQTINGKPVTFSRYADRESSIEGAEHWGFTALDGLDSTEVAEAHHRLRELERTWPAEEGHEGT